MNAKTKTVPFRTIAKYKWVHFAFKNCTPYHAACVYAVLGREFNVELGQARLAVRLRFVVLLNMEMARSSVNEFLVPIPDYMLQPPPRERIPFGFLQGM